MTTAFDPTAERARYQARLSFLADHWGMSLELAPGIRFQPETEASVEDQVRETFWSEGNDPELATPEAWGEMRTSFGVLAPRREKGAISVAATLMFAFPDESRNARLATLAGFPDGLRLVLDDGREVAPEVDRGYTGGAERLPSVLALRYAIPEGRFPVALVSQHSEVAGRFEGPSGWANWLPRSLQGSLSE